MENLILAMAAIAVMVVLKFTKEKPIMDIDFSKVSAFCGFLAMIFVFRVLYFDYLMYTGSVDQFPQLHPAINDRLWTIALVFYEDVLFSLPIYFAFKYLKRRWMAIVIAVFLSCVFAAGHLYQGWMAVAMTVWLPYFVTYHYGKKYGYGTTMCCHVLYDFSTVLSIKMLPYILS